MEIVRLDTVFEFIRNGASIKQDDRTGGIPITRIETIWNEVIDTNRLGYADITSDLLSSHEKYLLEKGDILMSHINSPKHLGKCAIYKGEPQQLIHGMNLLCLRTKTSLLFPEFIKYYFNSNEFKAQILKISNQSVNQASFSTSSLKKLEIPLPPLTIQQKIAAILDAADELRQKDKALLKKYDELTQALFLDMFGDPVANPKGWPIGSVSTVCEKICGGGTPSTSNHKYYEGTIPWVTPKDMKSEYIFDSIDHVNMDAIESSSAKLIPAGNVLMVIRSGILKHSLPVAINKNEVTINQDMKAFFPNPKVTNSTFLKNFFQAVAPYLLNKVRAVTADNIEFRQIKELNFPMVPLKLQDKFADQIKIIEQQKTIAQESSQKSEELFNSLLQQAFNGKLI
jgi:type I restriction enzyme S subunit